MMRSIRNLLAPLGLLFLLAGTMAEADSLRKPAKTVLRPGDDPTRIAVKFRDGLYVRLRNNHLVSTNAGLFAGSQALFDSLSAGTWERADVISEDAIDQLRHRAEQRLGRSLPDNNLQFYLTLPPGLEAGAVIDQLNQLDIVDRAQPVPRAAPAPQPPNPPDFQPMQLYDSTFPVGGSVFDTWTSYGVFGAGVEVGDVEYSFNSNHVDLPAINNLTPNAVDPFNDNDHGTATLGEMSALQNGFGTTGIAYDAAYYFAGAEYPNGYNVGAGITTLASQLRPGDVLLIEQQVFGPNTTQAVLDTGGQFGCVPVEWFEPYYNAVVMAVGQGIIVVETSGNGGQNLDNPIYSTGNGGNWPFLPQNRSGAILVSAGASYNGSSTEGSPLYYNNYGSCIDMQNWGENIVTTGYGDLYDTGGADYYYTADFGGSSGAGPIVAGEAALLQSIYKNATSQALTAPQIKSLLRNTGALETSGQYPVYNNIGPRPNLLLATQTALSDSGPPVIVMYSTNATALVNGTATLGVAASGLQPLSYQWSFNNVNLVDGGGVSGSQTAQLVLNNLTAAQSGTYTITVTNRSGHAAAAAVLAVIPDPSLSAGVLVSNIYTFTAAYDESPIGLTPDGEGDFFGTQQYGGTNGFGAVFEFTPATSEFSILYSFMDSDDGAYPGAGLTLGSDGNFYGTTYGDGVTNFGSVFSITPDGIFDPLYNFSASQCPNGGPAGTLLEGSPGLFYGTTYSGGPGNQGVIFTIDDMGNFNVVHNFTGADGAGPAGGLVIAGDGNFYGMTDWGGTNSLGTIYRLTSQQQFQSLYSFDGATNGQNPMDDLTVGLDGKLYGRATGGGAEGQGTLFSFTTNGVFQLLHTFSGPDGSSPYSAMAAGNDGNLYGATQYGGTNANDGVIYETTPGGQFSVVAYFNGDDGNSAVGPIIRDNDGNFYGTTFNGGYGAGVIYELTFSQTPRPVIQTANRAGGQLDLACMGVAGRAYQAQYTTNLAHAVWTPLGAPVTATNASFSVTDPAPPPGERFYRLKFDQP